MIVWQKLADIHVVRLTAGEILPCDVSVSLSRRDNAVTIATFEHYWKTVTTIVIKFSAQTGNGCGIMSLHSPGGSILEWGAGRVVPCLVLLVVWIWRRELRRTGDTTEHERACGRRSRSGASQLAVDGLATSRRPSFLRWKSHQQSMGRDGRSLPARVS